MQWLRSHGTGRIGRLVGVLLFLVSILAIEWVRAQQPPAGMAQPRLVTIMPMGGKAGSTVEVVLSGQEINDPQGLLFSHPAIKAELVSAGPAADPKQSPAKGKAPPPAATIAVKYKVTIPADIPPGIHDVRILNRWGVSNPRAFVVGDQNEMVENEPNSDVPQAQKVEMGTTINGVISAPTDVDYFSFAGKKGQRVVVSCLASSIDSRLYPVVELYEPSGKRIANNRDYYHHDALVDATLAADGDYLVRVFQFTHTAGTAEYFYRLTVSTAPWIDSVFPSVVEPGKPAQVTVWGRNLPGGQPDPTAGIGGSVLEKMTVTVNAPNDPQRLSFSGYLTPVNSMIDGFEYRVRNAAGTSNPFLINFARAPLVLENGKNASRENAQALNVPCEVSGRLDSKRSGGWFSVAAKKGDVLSIELLSDRIGAPTDLALNLYNADMKGTIVEADDDPEILSPNQFYTRTGDPQRYRFAVPADGRYLVFVKSQASTDMDVRYRYHLRITPEQPDFRLVVMPTSPALLDAGILYQGSSQDFNVYAWRQDNFNGDIALAADGLPPGVTCKAQTIPPGAKTGLLVITANPDAPPWAGDIRIKGTATINGKPVVREARSASIIWPNPVQQGQPPNVPTFTRIDRGLALAVRDKGPFGLTAEADKEAVQAGDKVNVKLKVDRYWPDFKATLAVAPVLPGTLAPVAKPPPNLPITINPVSIAADKNEGTTVIDIKPNVAPGKYTFVFRGTAQVQYEKEPGKPKVNASVTLPSTPVVVNVLPKELAKLTVAPTLAGKLGGQAELAVKLARMYDFNGEFKLQLVLPGNARGISADEVTVAAGKDDAKLTVKIADDAPPGNLQGLLIRATAMYEGAHPVVHEAKFNLNITK
jgi:hypothetical protein